jgi:hypothetical protein
MKEFNIKLDANEIARLISYCNREIICLTEDSNGAPSYLKEANKKAIAKAEELSTKLKNAIYTERK